MGSMFSIFHETPQYKVLMIGLDGAGKTTLLYRLQMDEVLSTLPTIGFNTEKISFKGMTLDIWDIGGQRKIRDLWKYYHQNANIVIFVVDSTDNERFDEASEELRKIITLARFRQNLKCVGILNNKCDCSNSHSLNTDTFLDKAILNVPILYQNCSAISKEGLSELLERLHETLQPVTPWVFL